MVETIVGDWVVFGLAGWSGAAMSLGASACAQSQMSTIARQQVACRNMQRQHGNALGAGGLEGFRPYQVVQVSSLEESSQLQKLVSKKRIVRNKFAEDKTLICKRPLVEGKTWGRPKRREVIYSFGGMV